MHTIVKYGLIVVKDGHFLINRKQGTDLFLMPGGKPKAGESAQQCLYRELKEEHGVELVVSSLVHVGDFEDKAVNEPDTRIRMHVYQGTIQGEPVPAREIEEQSWFSRTDDPSLLSPIIRYRILPLLLEQGVI